MQKLLVRSVFLVLLLSAAESWALPPCPGSWDQYTWTNCYGTYPHGPNSEAAGETYVGEWKDGGYHGQGTYTWAKGDKYVGEWKDHEEHGQGTYTYADGEKYVGEWADGKSKGKGCL